MIPVIFISLLITYFLVRHFNRKRDERNEEYHERKMDAYNNLLNSLKEKDTPGSKEENYNNENL